MATRKQFIMWIPGRYYEHGTPFVTDYMGKEGEGLAYKLSPEERFEQEAAFGPGSGYNVISLCSPYITGFGFEIPADQLSVFAVDIERRTVILEAMVDED